MNHGARAEFLVPPPSSGLIVWSIIQVSVSPACHEWLPSMDGALRERGYRKWKKAVALAVNWVDDDE